jgi:hypothetical protein
MELIGEINQDGHFVPDNIEECRMFLVQNYEGKKVELNLKGAKKKRSDKQNRWYWGVAVPTVQTGIKEQTGILHEKETIHALILSAVGAITMETKNVMGMNVIEVKQKRTSDMTTTEFVQFHNQVQQHFAEKGIDIPDPVKENYWNQICSHK